MLFTTDELYELYSIIDYFHTFFIATNIGTDILSKSDKILLYNYGVDINSFKDDEDYISYAYKFGLLATALKKDKVRALDFDSLKRFIRSGQFIPLTDSEQYALQFVRQQAYNDIKGLGNRIKQSTGQIFIESSRTRRLKVQRIIRKETKKAIRERKTVQELSSTLAKRTGDYARDFDRIAQYVLHDAYQNGIASQLLKQHGEDVEVFYSVYPGACEHCIEIYLTDGKGSEPKIFKLKDIIANGTNIGKKVKDWKSSIAPCHPWCRCTINLKPENTIYDVEKKRFTLVRNTYGVNRKSKIKVTVTKT